LNLKFFKVSIIIPNRNDGLRIFSLSELRESFLKGLLNVSSWVPIDL